MGLTLCIQLDRLVMVRLMEERLIDLLPTPEVAQRVSSEWLYSLLRPYHRGPRDGLAKMKATRLPNLAKQVVSLGGVPRTYDDLRAIDGIGDHIARLILAHVDGETHHFAEDTHTKRVLQRLGIDSRRIPVAPSQRAHFSCAVTYLGRKHCRPQPKCSNCPVKNFCTTTS
jgi:endonuclease III